MNVTTSEFNTRCNERVDRAAAAEEIVITQRGIAKARLVPASHVETVAFDARKQAQVLADMARIREHLANKGLRFTREEIRQAFHDPHS